MIWSQVGDEGRAIMVIFTETTKESDPVNHERYLLEIKSFGLTDQVYSWLTSYLSLTAIGQSVSTEPYFILNTSLAM